MKHLRMAINVAVTLAMMLPTGILAECCCRSDQVGCCAVETSVEVPKTTCCSCERKLLEKESLHHQATRNVGIGVRPSCECCLRVRSNTSALPAHVKNVVTLQSIVGKSSLVDGSLQPSSEEYIEHTSPPVSHNKRQALLCVWIH